MPRSPAEVKARLLKCVGYFAGSGSSNEVQELISELERTFPQLPVQPELLRGSWSLVGDTAGSSPPILVQEVLNQACFRGYLTLRSVSLDIFEDLSARCSARIAFSAGRVEVVVSEFYLQRASESKFQSLPSGKSLKVGYIDDDILILLDGNDPLYLLDGYLGSRAKREVYLRTEPGTRRSRFWRGFRDRQGWLLQAPLTFLSWLAAAGLDRWHWPSSTEESRALSRWRYRPNVATVEIAFDPDLLPRPLQLYQVAEPSDFGLVWAMTTYSFWRSPTLAQKASMYNNMMYSGLFWASSFTAACALLRILSTIRCKSKQPHVVELACGAGLPSLAALSAGAKVTSTDLSPIALDLVTRSASLQPEAGRACFSVALLDIARAGPKDVLALGADVVVASDVLYDEDVASFVGRLAAGLLSGGARFIVTDPGRIEGRGRSAFIESLQETLTSAYSLQLPQNLLLFQTQQIPDHVLDQGTKAMQFGGQVDDRVGVLMLEPSMLMPLS